MDYQQRTNPTKNQRPKNSRSCVRVVYIAGDTLRHQPMGADHMVGVRVVYIAGDTLRHQPMGADHMVVLQLREQAT